MRDSDVKLIRRLPLFADIAPQHFDALVVGAFLQAFPARLTLQREGDLPDFLHIVVEGAVEIYGTLDDRETALAILSPPATFVLAAVVRDEAYLTSARTLQPTQVLLIPAAAVRTVFDADAAFARATVRELASRYRDVVKSLKGYKLRVSVERLANYLLKLAPKAAGQPVTLPIEKRTLASFLGMTPEHLSRAFAELRAHGVEVSGQQMVIHNKVELARLARPHPFIDGPSG